MTTLLGTLVVLLLIPSKLSRSSQHSCATSFTSASESNFKSQKNVAGIRDIFNNNDINKNNNGIPNHSLDQTEEALEKSAKRSSSSSSLSISKGPPPGPVPWPVIGSLHLMANYSQVPFEGFSAISKTYGDIFSITLGSTPCVIIKTFPHFKEVLITKGAHFGGRPNFLRYDFLFGGSRDNCKFIVLFLFYFHVCQCLLVSAEGFSLVSLSSLVPWSLSPFVLGLETRRKPASMSPEYPFNRFPKSLFRQLVEP